MKKLVPVVFHPRGIAPTFLKLDSWLPWAGFISIISNMGINQIKKEKVLLSMERSLYDLQ